MIFKHRELRTKKTKIIYCLFPKVMNDKTYWLGKVEATYMWDWNGFLDNLKSWYLYDIKEIK